MKEESLPLTVKKRIAIAQLFESLKQNEKRKWARIFRDGLEILRSDLVQKARELELTQEIIDENYILWKNPKSGTNECLFYIIKDPAVFNELKDLVDMIEKLMPVFTYAIVHQRKDGENTFDIFRLSKFSYLEHCNRVKLTR